MVSTQNIDTLEQVAHIEKVIQCHGEYREHRHTGAGGSHRKVIQCHGEYREHRQTGTSGLHRKGHTMSW